MATVVIMPRQGQSVDSCVITKWHKQKGESVQVGDLLFSYETDKASFDEEAKVNGMLLAVFFEEGDDVPCLTNVCVIGYEGESAVEYHPIIKEPSADAEAPVSTDNELQAVELNEPENIYPATGTDTLKISPRARNLAEKSGIDYRYATPTGPYGRIVEKDIVDLKESGMMFTNSAKEAHLQENTGQQPDGTGLGGRITLNDLDNQTDIKQFETQVVASTESNTAELLYEEVKVSNIRKVIAKAMHQSLLSTAQLTLNASFDVTDIVEFRKKVKVIGSQLGLENITLNEMIICAVSRTLANHSALNAYFLDDRMLFFKNVNIGIAVDTERGLMVPTLFNANMKSLNQISVEAKQLVKQCQTGSINPDLLKNASFTVTNLGALDIESFTPVLNPPQTGILGINNITQKVKEVEDDFIFYPAMGLSLTFDHRALDGAPAARFLKELKNNLENFSTLLAR